MSAALVTKFSSRSPATIGFRNQASPFVFSRTWLSAKMHMRIFADSQVRENTNGLAWFRKPIVAGERDENFVTNAADIDDCVRRQSAHQFTVEKSDHGFVKKIGALKRGNVLFVILSEAKNL